jgi:hypothetical protein
MQKQHSHCYVTSALQLASRAKAESVDSTRDCGDVARVWQRQHYSFVTVMSVYAFVVHALRDRLPRTTSELADDALL